MYSVGPRRTGTTGITIHCTEAALGAFPYIDIHLVRLGEWCRSANRIAVMTWFGFLAIRS